MDAVTLAFLAKIEALKAERAQGAMEFPKSKKFEHGVQVGFWQGLDAALNLMKDVLDADQEAERKK